MAKCEKCKGTGILHVECPSCRGSGKTDMAGAIVTTMPCPTCLGQGKIPVPCAACNSTGQVEDKAER